MASSSSELHWKILDTYFQHTPSYFTNHHLDSFHDFVDNKIPYTMKTLNPFVMLKNDSEGKLKHEARVYIGGKDADRIYISKPTIVDSETGVMRNMFPNEARLKDMTYASDLHVDIEVEFIDHSQNRTETSTFKQVRIGMLPIMLHSKLCALHGQPPEVLKEMGECPYDQGGYFIVDGKEKVIVAQERIVTNRLFVNPSGKPEFSYEALIRCTPQDNNLFPKTVYFGVHSKEYLKGKRQNAIALTCPNINKNIPLFTMFRALGVESDRDILQYILYDVDAPANKPLVEFLRASIVDGNSLFTQTEALEYLANFVDFRNVDAVRYILMNDFLPQMGRSFEAKALELGHIVNKMVKTAMGMIPETDRDNFMFKRVEISGFLLANLFRDLYNEFRNHVRNKMDSQYIYGPWKSTGAFHKLINPTNIRMIFSDEPIEQGLRRSLKGQWGAANNSMKKEGVVQDLNRLSYMGYVSHMRRVYNPIDSSTKIVGPHRLHSSQWGIVCPAESPDGGNVGLLKHFSMLTRITFDSSHEEMFKCLMDNGLLTLEMVRHGDIAHGTKVFINDVWKGIHMDAPALVAKLKALRRHGYINAFTGISWNIFEKEVHVRTDSGRCCRPLYVVRNNRLAIPKDMRAAVMKGDATWLSLVSGSRSDMSLYDPLYHPPKASQELTEDDACSMEYIDAEEANNCLVAMRPHDLKQEGGPHKQYTHCEIHPSTILSVYTNSIPLSNHNQAPRNVFSGAQGKQAIGIYATNFNHRIDTASYVLHYPQMALVHTRYSGHANSDVLPNGENLIVAIATYTGYNQEDSIIINKNSIERGLFNISVFKSFVDSEESNPAAGERIIFANPLELQKQGVPVEFKTAYWNKLDADGLPKLNEHMYEEDVYLGKVGIHSAMVKQEDPTSLFAEQFKREEYRDKSKVADKVKYGTIDKVYVHRNEEGLRKVKIRFRNMRKPELGDKMASRHGQKGVCGMILPQENMPFTKDGLVPDIIINPHAIPTRMTIAHLVECILCKLCCASGTRIDGTAFEGLDVDGLYDVLQNKYKMNKYGDELMYNGMTGEQIPTHIFVGPTYYFRLKHMVKDKVNYRRTGAMNTTTRQPTKGRAQGGGLRIGEMETNALLGHGISNFIKETMMERSDAFQYHIDNEDGTILMTNPQEGMYKRDPQTSSKDVGLVQTPYALKMFLQEMEAFGISSHMLSTSHNQTYEEEENEEDAVAEEEALWRQESLLLEHDEHNEDVDNN